MTLQYILFPNLTTVIFRNFVKNAIFIFYDTVQNGPILHTYVFSPKNVFSRPMQNFNFHSLIGTNWSKVGEVIRDFPIHSSYVCVKYKLYLVHFLKLARWPQKRANSKQAFDIGKRTIIIKNVSKRIEWLPMGFVLVNNKIYRETY